MSQPLLRPKPAAMKHEPTVTNIQGTDPIVNGETYVFYHGNRAIAGTIVDSTSRSEVYIKHQVHAKQGPLEQPTLITRHYLAQRLLVFPLYRFN